MKRGIPLQSCVAVLGLVLGACTGNIGSSGTPGSDAGGQGSSGGSSVTDPNSTPPSTAPLSGGVALACDKPGILPGLSSMRRLTNVQFESTLAALFGSYTTIPKPELPQETLVSGFSNIAAGQTSSPALLEGYHAAALAVANGVVNGEGLNQLAPCAAGADAHGCGATFIGSMGERAFRRPLAQAEHARLLGFFDAQLTTYGYAAAVRDTLEALLLAPQLAFRIEYGEPGTSDATVPLTSYEVASRLSYFLTDSPPDAALATAAANSTLQGPELEAHARRLLADPRAVAVVARFHDEWLRLSKLDQLNKSATTFPSFDEATATSMATATRKYVADAFWNDGTLGFLLTDKHAYVDASLAPIYGVAPPAALSLLDVSSQPRAGLLTQAGLLAALAKPANDDPIHRGLFVLSYLLCAAPAGPPKGVPALEEPKAGDPPQTTRQHIELTHSPPACAACHTQIDGIGFGFGNYDAIGQYRTTENGFPVDASGAFSGTQDIDGPFDGVVAMADKLASSKQTRQCVANQWFNYAFGRVASDADACALLPIVNAMQASGGNMRELLVAISSSDAFRYLERAQGVMP